MHCIEGTEGWEIAPVIRKAASFYSKEQIETICKPAFGSVQLGECLKQYCGDAEAQIDFCGVCTGYLRHQQCHDCQSLCSGSARVRD